MVMILFFAAVLQFLEHSNQPHYFHTWMYVVWVTVSTVGYGDITPKTTLGTSKHALLLSIVIVIFTPPPSFQVA